jgi:hypothetical protein
VLDDPLHSPRLRSTYTSSAPFTVTSVTFPNHPFGVVAVSWTPALFSDVFEDSIREPDPDSRTATILDLASTQARDVVESDLFRAGVTAGLD